MKKLVLKGWQRDSSQRPVSLSDALREELGLTLPAAKRVLDELAESGTAIVEAKTLEATHRFKKRADELGVIYELLE
jgi:hypothetical protein